MVKRYVSTLFFNEKTILILKAKSLMGSKIAIEDPDQKPLYGVAKLLKTSRIDSLNGRKILAVSKAKARH